MKVPQNPSSQGPHKPRDMGSGRQQSKSVPATLGADCRDAWPEEFCRQVLMRSPWPMCVLDAVSHRVVEANDAALRHYGMERAEFLEHGMDMFTAPDAHNIIKRNLDMGLGGPVTEMLTEHLLQDGTLLPVEVMAFPLLWKGHPARFVLIRDPLIRAAGDLSALSSERLELMGRVSGSIAHDLNNLLMVIQATAFELASQGDRPQRTQAELILNTAASAARLTQQLLSFGRRQLAQPREINLNALLDEYEEMVRVVVGRSIEVEVLRDKDLGQTLMDPLQLREVLLNLAINAKDAMPRGGKLRISTTNFIISEDKPVLGLMAGHYARLTVEDNGLGMDNATQLRAFEPYFTTKEKGYRSGLGLASVDSVVRQSGGGIQLTSIVGKGTRFDIYLPCLPQTAAATHAVTESPLVLLVEDQAELRKLLEEFLASRGYTVIACASGEEGLMRARNLERPPAVIVTDVVMSGMTARDLLDRVRELYPEVRALFISGQVRSIDPMSGEPRDTAFLQKPFSLDAVQGTLKRLLGSPTQKI